MIVYFSTYKYVKGVWTGDYETLKTVTGDIVPVPRKGEIICGLKTEESEYKVTKVVWDKSLRSVCVHVEKV